MRVPSPHFVQAARVARGAILEEGDGELLIPPALQLVTDVIMPVDAVHAASAVNTYDKSWAVQISGSQSGAIAGSQVIQGNFSRGLWRMRGRLGVAFTGTTNLTRSLELSLHLPSLIVIHDLAAFLLLASNQQSFQIDLPIAMSADGWFLALNLPTTIAGDVLGWVGAIVLHKIY